MRINAVIFDLDDTLYPERDFVYSGLAAVDSWVHENLGVLGFRYCAWELYKAGRRRTIFNEVLRFFDLPDDPVTIEHLVAVYRGHLPRLRLHDDGIWALDHVERRALKLGLVTDGYAKTQRNKVAALGLASRIPAIVYTDDQGREKWKPSPDAFLRIQQQLGVEPSECVYVGDNPRKDFLAPIELGWHTVHVVRPDGEYGEVTDYAGGKEPEFRIQSLRTLEAILG